MDNNSTLHTLSLLPPPPGEPGTLASHPISQLRNLSLNNSSLGDTLIYLDSHLTPLQPIRIPSATLLSSGSSILTRYLTSPTYQHRILRRKKLLKDGLPLGVRFVIDLSPPVEGEDAVEVTERLWCPDSVRRWKTNPLMRPAKYQEVDVGKDNEDAMMGVSKAVVKNELSEFFESTWGKKSVKRGPMGDGEGGSSMCCEQKQGVASTDAEMPLQPSPPSIHYDNCVFKGCVFGCDTTTQKTGIAEAEAEISDTGDCNDGLFEVQLKREVKEEQDMTTAMKSAVDSDELRLPPAYSSARHIAALERVIGVLMGIDPHIFSATMWYTVYKVAEMLDLGLKVVDYIVGWLFAGNDAFIEFFTPLCLEIADGIKSPFLFRECFAISVARQLASTNSSDITQVYPVESAAPSSPYQMAINAASLSLRRRVNEKWRHVFSMSWLETEIPLMKILSEFIISGDGKYGEDLVQAATDVYEYIRGTVESMLIQISAGCAETPMAPPAAPPNIHPAVWDDWRSAVFKESGVPLMFNRYTWMQIRDLNIRDGTSTFEDSHGPKDQNYFTWDSNSLFGALRDKALKTFPARLVVGSKLKRQVYGEVPPPIMWDDSEISDLATDNGKISFISGPYWNSKSWRNQLLRTLTAAKIEKEDPPSSSLPPMGAISLTNSQQSMVENSNCACIIPGTFDQSTLASDASSSFTAGYTPINSVRSGGPEPAHTPSCPNLEPVAPLLLENDNTNFRIKPHLLTTSNIVPIWPCDIFTWPSIRKNPTLHILVEISEGSTKFSGLLSDRRQALITKIVESIPRTMCHQTGQVADIPHWKEVKVEVLYFDPPAAQLMHSEDFYTQISNYLKSVASEICATPTTTSDGERDRSSGILNEWMDFQLLSCFTDNEWKYMPIWAGGEDDGSGAIFGQMMKTLVVGGDAPPNPTRNNNYHKAKDDDDDPDDLYTVLASVSDSQGSTVVLTDDDIKSEGTELGVWSIDGSTTMSETGDHDWEKIGIDEDGDNYGKNSIARGAMTPRENDVIMDDNDGVESTGAGKVNEDGVTDEDMEWDYDNEDDDEEDAGWDDEF